MGGLKNADNFQNGERFRGAGILAWLALGIGLVATILFFVLALKGGEIPVKNHADEVVGQFRLSHSMAFSWLFAVMFFLTLGVGGLFWTMLHHATNSGWGTVVRRLMENLGFMIPVVLFLSLPMVLNFNKLGFKDALWEWMAQRRDAIKRSEETTNRQLESGFVAGLKKKAEEARQQLKALEQEKASKAATPGAKRFFEDRIAKMTAELAPVISRSEKSDEELRQELNEENFLHDSSMLYSKRNFLNESFWTIRFLIYVLVLGGAIVLLRSNSISQDTTGNPRTYLNMRIMSCVLLLPVAVCYTFLVFDWLMALDYTWFSTMWGVYLFAGAALNSMGTLILIVTGLRKAGYLEKVITREHYHIMGKLVLAFVIFWAYIAFSQFFLIWYANITEETRFFLTRNTGFWNTYTILFLVAGHFFIPFLALLIRAHKTTTWIICAVAIWNLIMHFLDLYWIVIAERAPSLTKGASNWLPGMWVYDLLAWLGVGGIFLFCLFKALGSASLFPCRDPRLDESLNLAN